MKKQKKHSNDWLDFIIDSYIISALIGGGLIIFLIILGSNS